MNFSLYPGQVSHPVKDLKSNPVKHKSLVVSKLRTLLSIVSPPELGALLSLPLASGTKTDTFFAFQTCVHSMNAAEQTGHFAKSAQKRKFASEDI